MYKRVNVLSRNISAITPYLFLVWLLVASSTVARFEPAPYDIFLILLFLSGIIFSLLSYGRKLMAPFVMLWFVVVCSLASILVAVDMQAGIAYLGITCYLAASWTFFVGLIGRYGKRAYDAIWSGYIAAALFSAFLGLLGVFAPISGVESYVWGEHRAAALFKDPNVLGAFLVPPAIFAMARLAERGTSWRLIWMLVWCVLTLGVLTSLSRGAWANYLLATALYLGLILARNRGQRTPTWTMIVTTVLVVAMLLYMINETELMAIFIERMKFQPYDEDRLLGQVIALQASLKNPFGIGPAQSELVLQHATHNLYLRVLVENGWAALVTFLGFLFITLSRAIHGAFKRDFPYQRDFALLLSVLVGALFNSFFIDSLHWRHLWILLALPWLTIVSVAPRKIAFERIS